MIFGHDDKIEIFKRLVKEENLHQAYLFYGEPQVGKFTFAKSFAYFLEYDVFEIIDKPLIDFLEILPNAEKGIISLKTIQEIKNFVFQKPFRSKKRLVLIDQANTLTDEAQSALLKIFEEPSPSALFILVVNEPSILLPPLLSRLTKVYFRRFSQKELEEILISYFNLSKDKAEEVSKKSFGRIGRVFHLILDFLSKEDRINRIEKNKEESFSDFLNQLILNYYLKDKFRYSGIINWLLLKEWQANALNLNFNLQKKATLVYINGYGYNN